MKKFTMLAAVLIFTVTATFAQAKKKVAVVTFYANKMVDLSDVGLSGVAAIADLKNDPDFNLAPLLQQYHDKFFNDYAKKFPFELVDETLVTGNAEYHTFQPTFLGMKQDMSDFQLYPGYEAVDPTWSGANVNGMLKLFPDVDGVMFVYVNFAMVKGFGLGGTASTKMRAFTHIALYNKKGDKVFVINENANSSKTGVMVGGVPVMKPEKVLPMCESALKELMEDLDKRMQKIIDKSGKKL